jgi:hypothetical protein
MSLSTGLGSFLLLGPPARRPVAPRSRLVVGVARAADSLLVDWKAWIRKHKVKIGYDRFVVAAATPCFGLRAYSCWRGPLLRVRLCWAGTCEVSISGGIG